MIGDPTIAEERLARLMAFWHGQKIVFRRDGQTMTVAGSRGFSSGYAYETGRYVESHWREYVEAARAVMEIR